MRFDKDWLNRRWVDYTVAACIAVAFYLFLSHISLFFSAFIRFFAFLKPVIIGVIISYVLNPLVNLYERFISRRLKIRKKRNRHTLAILCGTVTVGIFLTLLMLALIPQLISSIMTLVTNLNSYVSSFQAFIQSIAGDTAEENETVASLLSTGDSFLMMLEEKMPSAVNNVVSTAGSIGINVFNGVISFIMAIYFLADKERLLGGVARIVRLILTEKQYQATAEFWLHCHAILIRYIGGDLLDGLIVGVANFIFMKVMNMPYAAVVSVFVGVTNLAPTFGPLAGAVIGGFILVLINPWHALWFILFTIVLQTIDGYVIKPKFFGGTLGVSSVWILICIIVGGRMLGVWGILLAIPFAAISDYIYKEMIIRRLQERRGISFDEESSDEESSDEESDDEEDEAEKKKAASKSAAETVKAVSRENSGKEETEEADGGEDAAESSRDETEKEHKSQEHKSQEHKSEEDSESLWDSGREALQAFRKRTSKQAEELMKKFRNRT